MKKVIGCLLIVCLFLTGCSNFDDNSKTDEFKYDKDTFDSKYDLIFFVIF